MQIADARRMPLRERLILIKNYVNFKTSYIASTLPSHALSKFIASSAVTNAHFLATACRAIQYSSWKTYGRQGIDKVLATPYGREISQAHADLVEGCKAEDVETPYWLARSTQSAKTALLERCKEKPINRMVDQFLATLKDKYNRTKDVSADPLITAAVKSFAPQHANLLMNSTGDYFYMNDADVAFCLALQLGLKPTTDMQDECVCGHSLAALNGREINNHLMTCNTNAGAVTFAHNMVLRSVAQMCTDAGAQTNVEEAVMGSTRHRINIHAAWAERSILIDVVGTAAESASTRVSSAVEAGFAAQKAEIRKETNAFY
eukprot:g47718.t1